MIILHIESVNDFKPRPDFSLRIFEDGSVEYKGRYYVGVRGKKLGRIDPAGLQEIRVLQDFLNKRNQKNYLKKKLVPIYSVVSNGSTKLQFEVDELDVVSEDIVGQIIDLAGVRSWIHADLDLYLVMNKPGSRTKELAVLRASGPEEGIGAFLAHRKSSQYRETSDYWSFRIGKQKPDLVENPVIYFSYTDYQIQNSPLTLLLNQGPPLPEGDYAVFLFISFGKRYNDPRASYFLVLAPDAPTAQKIFKKVYPHFMPRDFQLVDTGVRYLPIPLFETHIPVAIR